MKTPATGLRRRVETAGLCVVSAILVGAAPAAEGPASAPRAERVPTGREVMERYDRAFYYSGRDLRANVVMEMGAGDKATKRRDWTFLRLTLPNGAEQMYLLYFHKPAGVRRMSCMIRKHAKLRDERWMFVPASGQVLKVQASDRSSFLGSDFAREEFSGRGVDADEHTLLRTEILEGRECYVVRSVPRDGAEFSRYTSWIDRATHLPLRQEYFNARGEVTRVFTGRRIVEVPSRGRPERRYATLLERAMSHPGGRWTRMVLDSVSYDIGLRETDFSERRMQTPISEWLH